MMEDFKINEDHCFHGENFNIDIVHDALEAYNNKSKSVEEWMYKDDTPIFLDTNVILNIYMTAIPSRTNILRFIEDNKDRIFITNRVQTEYLRHRLDFIDTYKNNLTKSASQFRTKLNGFEFCAIDKINDILASIVKEEFVDSLPNAQRLVEEVKQNVAEHDVVNEGYKETKTKLNQIKEIFEKEYDELYKKASIDFSDYILEKISKTHILGSLTEEEVLFTKDLYNRLLERFKTGNSSQASYLRFPGSGEDQSEANKQEPWGDLLIYHEIISFMAVNHRDAIFLTYDKSKQDWMTKKGENYSYYVVDAFSNTRQTLFICRADDFFTSSYNPSHKEIIDEDSVGVAPSVKINIESKQPEDTLNSLKNISKEEFLSQMKVLNAKNGDSEDVHISKSFFIYVYLGKQGYRYSKSFQILDQLRGSKIEEYDYNNGEYEYKCLKLKEQPKPE